MNAREPSQDMSGAALGPALAAARAAAGLRQVPVAERVGMTQARLSRIERGAAIPTPEDMTALLDAYGVRGTRRRNLEAMALDARTGIRDQRLVVQRGRTAAMQARWSRIMRGAHLERAYHPSIVVGSLQTAAYAGVVLGADPAALRQRIEQQDVLGSGPGRKLVVVQTEGSLRATVGSRWIMIDQLDQLITATSHPRVRLGVIPAQQPLPFTCGTPFHVFEGTDVAAVVVGVEVAAATLTEPDDLQHFVSLFERLAALAVFDDDARTLLERIASDHR
ncbi:MAG: Scr1 family TA system antitoxin-like transcriptional regulator [Pseudonocardia sp.]